MNTELQNAYRFFKEHAGWSNPPGRAVCAMNLARAERAAAQAGWTVDWEYETGSHFDTFGLSECCESANRKCRHEHGGRCLTRYHYCPDHTAHDESLYAILRDTDGDVLESLGMIEGANSAYRRVVAAELASKALYTIDANIKREIEQERAWLEVAAL